VAHIRELRPEIVVTHDAYGGLTGHPDHVHTHRVTVLAAEAAGLEQLYPDAGPAWQPLAVYLATHPHSVLPTLIAGLPPDSRENLLSTEWYVRWRADSPTGTDTELTLGP
jgi:LmbE family N-acetylglucosaminyl deacetylase